MCHVVIYDCDEVKVVGYEDLTRVKIYEDIRYLKGHSATCKWAEGSPQSEEYIYRACLQDGYNNPANIDQKFENIN